jgi:hypothetical protein
MRKHRSPKPITDTEPFVAREDLARPGGKMPHLERLAKAQAVDLRDNVRLEPESDGYWRVVPLDPTRCHGVSEGQEEE